MDDSSLTVTHLPTPRYYASASRAVAAGALNPAQARYWVTSGGGPLSVLAYGSDGSTLIAYGDSDEPVWVSARGGLIAPPC